MTKQLLIVDGVKENKHMKYRERKPDIETESLRMWKTSEEERKEIEDDKGEGIEIKLKDDKGEEIVTKICGFDKACDKTTNELMFAWKFKHEDKMMLFYLKNKEDEMSKKAIEFLKGMGNAIGYNVQDIEVHFKNMINDKGLMKMIEEKDGKDKGGKSD